MSKNKSKRGKTFLVAYDSNNMAVETIELTTEEYYEDLHEIIDSDNYRMLRGIVRLEGEIYFSDGRLSQRFETHYNLDGSYSRGRAEHADGTITED